MQSFLENRPSMWLVFFSCILAAVMMRPGMGALVAILLNLVVLLVLRKVAQDEGRLDRVKRLGDD